MTLNEDILEQAVLSWFSELGYQILNGLEIAPGGAKRLRQILIEFQQFLYTQLAA